MGILRLEVDGFRSLKHVLWEPKNLNVLIGPNGSGKSNLVRLFEMLSIAAKGNLGKYIRSQGGMEPLVWDGQASDITLKARTSPVKEGRLPLTDAMAYELTLSRLGKASGYKITHELLANYYRVENSEKDRSSEFLRRDSKGSRVFNEQEQVLTASDESVADEETLLSVTKGPFAANRYLDLFQKRMASWSVYHDFHVNQDAAIRQPVVARIESTVDPDGQNLITVLHTLYTGDRDFRTEVNNAMRAAFGDDFEELLFPPAADQRVQLRLRWKSLKREQSAADLSDGTLRFLFLLAVLGSPTPAPLIAIDEPETGLHPSMMPIVAEYAVEAARHTQVILTTHSPQFLDAFGDEVPTTTVVEWKDGETLLRTLDGKKLRSWLKEYSLGSLFRSGELEGCS